MYFEFSVYSSPALPRGAVFVFLSSCVSFALSGVVQGNQFILKSSAAQAVGFVETGRVDGYWEVEGNWVDSLELVIDQISRSCGLSRSYTMMDEGYGSQLNQQIRFGMCESATLAVNWSPAQRLQFNPKAPNTVLNILSSVRKSAFRSENEYSEVNFFDAVC
jgi:hypothetical protein